MNNRWQAVRYWVLVIGAALLLCGGARLVAAAEASLEDSNKVVAAGAASTNVAAIPLADVAAQAEAAFASLQSIEGNLSADQATLEIQQDLPVLTRESSVRLEESSKTLSSNPSLQTLQHANREWEAVQKELAEWKRSLTKRITQLDEDRVRLTQLEQVWKATRASVLEAKMPPEILEQVEHVLAAVKRTQDKAEAQQLVVLSLQTRVAEQDGRAIHTLTAIERAREAFIRRLAVRDGAPIWSAELWSESAQNLMAQSHNSLARQVQALRGYLDRKSGSLLMQGVLFLAILFGLIGVRRTLRRLGGDEASHAARVFDSPVATALVLALLATSWIYPEAPRLFLAISGAAAMIPTILVVRKLIDRRLFPVLNALVVFYFVDQLRVVAASQAVLSRLLLLVEMLGGGLFVGWLLGPGRLGTAPEDSRFWKAIGKACWVALGWFAAAFIADALGYVSLSKLLGHALLQSAYMALILYAVVRIIDGLCLSALSVPPLARLGLVKRHQDLLRSRARGVLTWAAILLWAVYVLEALSLRAPVFQDLREVLTTPWLFKVSPGDVVLFGITVWASFLVSRIVRFVLEEEVYARVKLAPGLHYSISKMVNYVILVVGFFIGVAVLGFDLTRLTILVGAFGVGLGFGLQNIINNFVSGLILLFERPIKVGDVVQLGDHEGVVKHIGIRASIVEAPNGSEFIVPNASLISETVTNWTLSDRLRRIDLPVAVGGPADARQVMELLKGAAAAQPRVLKDPPPQTLLGSFAGDSMNFELRAWINQTEDWAQIRSELALGVRAALAERNIAVK
ncbi:MAG: mechanosensitive ion channel domain-containing protein [Limisphaerales bacterium]